MQIWKKCIGEFLYYDARAAVVNDSGYIVRLSDDVIEVSYDDDEGAVCYKGKNNGDGHFDLKSRERNGVASLHRFPNSQFMEGYWREGDYRGMWRIRLA